MILLEQIKRKINKEINPENITLIDNSNLHSKHKSFDKNKYHIKIIITSNYLRTKNKIKSTKEIYKILDEELKKYIHSIQILIN